MVRLVALLLLGLGLTAEVARAETYPAKPVQVIVAFPPGGAVDFVGRLMAQQLAERLGATFIVENRPGASGAIGAQAVAKARPDGYTLLMAPLTNYAMNATLLRPTLGYDLEKDFAPVATVGEVPLVLVVNPEVGAKSVAEFVALAKAKPGDVTFGSSGNGSTEHLAAASFMHRAGITMLHVPYKGGAPAMSDLVGGQIMSMIGTTPSAMPHVKAGTLRALAVTTRARVAALPEVPTVAESGLPGFEVTSIYGILAPAATPPDIVGRLAEALAAITATPDVKERMLVQGVVATNASPAETGRIVHGEIARWAEVIAEAGIKSE
jgi:tripartite-type tricarboxylate transporter receptor subunit TctC